MNKFISNDELKIEMLPALEDEKGIREFAATFNGYEHFDRCTSLKGQLKKRECLNDIRSELFLMWRATRQNEDISLLDTYKELYPFFVKYLAQEA